MLVRNLAAIYLALEVFMICRFYFLASLAVAVIAFASSPASASTFLSVTGPVSDNVGLGGEGSPGDEQASAVEFTTTGLTDATISVTLVGLSSSQTIYAWVTNQIGTGTTDTNVLASTSFAGPDHKTAAESPFTGLTLGSGTYYLVLSALDVSNLTGWDDTKTSTETIANTAGNSYVASWANSGVYGTFAPAGVVSNITNDPNDDNFLFSITSTPLPATWTMMLAGLAGIGFIAFRRKKPAAPLTAS
jgi:hypothetical protein